MFRGSPHLPHKTSETGDKTTAVAHSTHPSHQSRVIDEPQGIRPNPAHATPFAEPFETNARLSATSLRLDWARAPDFPVAYPFLLRLQPPTIGDVSKQPISDASRHPSNAPNSGSRSWRI